jgi:iron complex transport system permease protein
MSGVQAITAADHCSRPTALTARKLLACVGVGTLGLLVAVAVALCMGPSGFSPEDLGVVFSNDAAAHVLREARLTRVLLGVLAGAGLGMSGAVLQALLRNPLADPFVVGISGGAAVGGTAAVVLMELLGMTAVWALPLGAYAGAIAVLLIIYAAASISGRVSSVAVLLAGVVFNAFCLALVSVLRLLVRAETAQSLMSWMMGSIASETWSVVNATAVYVAVGCTWLMFLAGRLHLLAQGDDTAARLGVDVERTRRMAYLATSLLVAGVVSVTGLIGFLGLMVPHVVRVLAGADARVVIPMSALLGGAALVLFDGASRSLFLMFGTEFPVGALTSLLGGPAFLWLLRKHLQGKGVP